MDGKRFPKRFDHRYFSEPLKWRILNSLPGLYREVKTVSLKVVYRTVTTCNSEDWIARVLALKNYLKHSQFIFALGKIILLKKDFLSLVQSNGMVQIII